MALLWLYKECAFEEWESQVASHSWRWSTRAWNLQQLEIQAIEVWLEWKFPRLRRPRQLADPLSNITGRHFSFAQVRLDHDQLLQPWPEWTRFNELVLATRPHELILRAISSRFRWISSGCTGSHSKLLGPNRFLPKLRHIDRQLWQYSARQKILPLRYQEWSRRNRSVFGKWHLHCDQVPVLNNSETPDRPKQPWIYLCTSLDHKVPRAPSFSNPGNKLCSLGLI